jgi:hypothetical protein
MSNKEFKRQLLEYNCCICEETVKDAATSENVTSAENKTFKCSECLNKIKMLLRGEKSEDIQVYPDYELTIVYYEPWHHSKITATFPLYKFFKQTDIDEKGAININNPKIALYPAKMRGYPCIKSATVLKKIEIKLD